MRSRCLTLGARFVAPQAVLGMYEVSEMAEIVNEDIILDTEGEIIK